MRTWTGDTGSTFLSHQDGTVSANATTQSPSTNQVPYTAARLSRSRFSYSFPVSPGPKFLRLFFYPAEYASFPRSNASFTVQSNQFTLLHVFNASLKAENTKTVFREYVVNVDGDSERLNLTFTPSQPNSYAFINGIEVLSMPSNLYYTSANDNGLKLVGTDTLFPIRTNTALETEYRIKVGGQGISPRNDTGLFRNWAGHDEDYLIKQKNPRNSAITGNTNGKMNITVNPDYVAPKELYRTARVMGTNTSMNKSLKLTWEFPVDSGFHYMIRFHFCQLDPNITSIGDRVFSLYIGIEFLDVMRWSQKQKGVAVYKDYAILIPKSDTQKQVNLSLQMMNPYESAKDKENNDPFLNGLEIFKISEFNNLAGPNLQNNNMLVQEGKNSSRTLKIVVAGVVSGVVVFFIFLWGSCKFGPLLLSQDDDMLNCRQRWPFNLLCQRFSLMDIKAATNNFNNESLVGVGGFGHVYMGYIDGISIPVAIKRLKAGSKQGSEEFLTEIKMLSQIRHRHLMHPYATNDKTTYSDAILNGLEIFKISQDESNNLAGPNPDPVQTPHNNIPAPKGNRSSKSGTSIIGIVAGVVSGVVLISLIILFLIVFFRRKTITTPKDYNKSKSSATSKWGPLSFTTTKSTTTTKSSLPSDLCRHFSLPEIKSATNNFDDVLIIGVGGFGHVYKGYIDGGFTPVAIKRLKPDSQQGANEFTNEIEMLSQLRHLHLRHHLTDKSDVYAFGVVLFEVLCARPPLIRNEDPKQESLAKWVRYCYQSGTMDQIVDPTLKGRIAPECFRRFCHIGVSCLSEVGTQRPSMKDVVFMLESTLQVQESAENVKRGN
ncbi:Receptor-like protein kinase FERONIA [Glycine soja]|uniref:Receptor-like protein kinase FERONIA n=1 Tax=Glycine soja TaxID=3848 RepID=A0A0B2PHP2_GLYSO|nr:Receptor-like protein kinase FERONIA [Glycine soja]